MSREYTIERSKQIDPSLQFMSVPREYTLLNSTDSPIEIQWAGETRVIPAVDTVAKSHDYWGPAMDLAGNYIPGSLVLRDIFEMDSHFGSEVMIWSAANCIKNVLGIDVKTGIATGAFAQRGVSLLPPTPDVETVDRIREAGRNRYIEWRLVDARNLISSFDEKNANRARVGMHQVPPPPEYNQAIFFLQAYQEKQKAMAEKVVNQQQSVSADLLEPPIQVDAYASVEEVSSNPSDSDLVSTAGGQDQPAPVQTLPDYDALAEKLLQDEEFMKVLRARAIMAGGKKKK